MARGASSETVLVLDCDPDLGQDLEGEDLNAARSESSAPAFRYARGRWRPPTDIETSASLGLLIIKGFITRSLTVAEYTSLELLGPGDVLQPWACPELDQSVAAQMEWTVAERMTAASLNREFLCRVSRWPEVVSAISRRLTARTHSLLFQLALSALRRIDDRVLLMLWQVADRWGTVTPSGVMLDIPLTHELLAAAVGARRPSVSAAVRRLVVQEQIRSLPRSRWLLLVGPPDEMRNHNARVPR